jgi:hypothetical protein
MSFDASTVRHGGDLTLVELDHHDLEHATRYASLEEAMRAEGVEDPDPTFMTNQAGEVIVIAGPGVVWSYSSQLGGFALLCAAVATPSTLGATLVAPSK